MPIYPHPRADPRLLSSWPNPGTRLPPRVFHGSPSPLLSHPSSASLPPNGCWLTRPHPAGGGLRERTGRDQRLRHQTPPNRNSRFWSRLTASGSPSSLAGERTGRRGHPREMPKRDTFFFFFILNRTGGKRPTLSIPWSLSQESDFSSLFAPGAKNTDHVRLCASDLNTRFNTRKSILDCTSQNPGLSISPQESRGREKLLELCLSVIDRLEKEKGRVSIPIFTEGCFSICGSEPISGCILTNFFFQWHSIAENRLEIVRALTISDVYTQDVKCTSYYGS